MKYKITFFVLILILIPLFSSCNSLNDNITYCLPFKITDDGKIQNNSNYINYSLKDFVLLLKKKNIEIKEIKGSDKAKFNDGGNVIFEDILWNYTFYPQNISPYDVDLFNELICNQNIETIYIETTFETFVFKQVKDKINASALIDDFYSDIIIINNPNFVTEKGVKIGNSFEYASEKYNFNICDIVKKTNNHWSVLVVDSNIMFVGINDKITSIELGYQGACGF